MCAEEVEKEVQQLRSEVRKREKQKKKRKMAASLSFDVDTLDEEGEDEVAEQNVVVPKKKIMKNPDVDTSHLPDKGCGLFSDHGCYIHYSHCHACLFVN